MRLEVLPLAGKTSTEIAVVIDVLRATSTMVTALANGCPAIIPAADPDEARALAVAGGYLLGGERGGLPLPGFDLGNSPREYTPKTVAGRKVVLTTTNGTRALLLAASPVVLVASFLNLPAAAGWLARRKGDVLISCAGTDGGFSLEDFACAGMLLDMIAKAGNSLELGDGAVAARAVYRQWEGRIPDLLKSTGHGRRLDRLGLGADLEFCARVGRYAVVPQFSHGEVVAGDPDAGAGR
ncbi:MAG: 2-phosphosulfolactate phosphatase [Clostridia bacterium]|nr:MAG: 2-phosphosulfolactate phosphatase [Clostridia bacterium]